MSGIQGFPSNQKVPLGTGITNNFVTVTPTDPNRAALDNLRFAFRVDNPTVPRTAGVGTGLENADGVNLFWVEDVGTPARVGDFFRAINGNAIHLEIPIVKVETNRFLLAVNSGLLPASGDDFYIMRYTTQRVDENGSQVVVATPGPTQFVLDGVDVEVERDTVAPANSKPFPVINLDNAGVPVDFATETTLAAIDTKTPALVGGAVPVTGPLTDLQLRASAVPVSGPLTDTELRASAVPVSAASLPLPTGAATAALQTSGNNSLTSIDGKVATETTLSGMSAKLPTTLGQKAMVASMAVTIASDQSQVPVSASSLPLPTGAATEATLSSLSAKINSDFGALAGATRTAAQVGNATGSADFGAGNSSAQTLRVVVASNQTAVPISATSLPLPTGAATEATLSAMNAKLPTTLGQKVASASLAVVLASDSLAPAQAGRTKVQQLFNDYSSSNVTTSAYVQLTASTSADSNKIEVFDSSGEAMIFAVGAAASEVDQFYIFPGGNGPIDLYIPSGSRISVKAKTSTATSGFLAVNLYS